MEIIAIAAFILFSMATSLGVGSSTIAIVNFFVALRDGVIDPTERAMMGVVYTVLRIAMGILFITLAIITGYTVHHGGTAALTPELGIWWTILAVIYLNAILMTLRLMPSKYGPGIQAGSWYTLGFLGALQTVNYQGAPYSDLLALYFFVVIIAIALVRIFMMLITKPRPVAVAKETPAENHQ